MSDPVPTEPHARKVVRIPAAGPFLSQILKDTTAPRPLRAREECSICRDIPPAVTPDDAWPPNADQLKDVVRECESGSGALRECPLCRRLYSYSYWFKFGEDPETTLREVDRALASKALMGAAKMSPWALRRADGLWVLRYDPTREEILPLLSHEERGEVQAELENLPYGLRPLEEKLRRFHAERALTEPCLQEMEDDRRWLRLDSDGEWHLWRGARLGFEAVLVQRGRVESILFWHDFHVRAEVKKALQQRSDDALENVGPKVLARLRSIDTAAGAALARIEAGTAWSTGHGDEVIAVGSSFYAVREKDREATPLDGPRVREWLAGAAHSRRSLAGHALDEERGRRLHALLDPAGQLELIRQGRLKLYSSSGSVLDFRDGHFQQPGRGVLSEDQVQALLEGKVYGWLKWT